MTPGQQQVNGSKPPTPFDRIGGENGVRAAVDRLYSRILEDFALQPHFAGVDMDELKVNQCKFLEAVLGGPSRYTGRAMSAAHGHRKISRSAFDAVLDHLVDALGELHVGSDIIERVVQTVASLEAEIVDAER